MPWTGQNPLLGLEVATGLSWGPSLLESWLGDLFLDLTVDEISCSWS